MITRMGTKIKKVGAVDADGYVDVLLVWDSGETETRELHLSDLRTETDRDREMLEDLSSAALGQRN